MSSKSILRRPNSTIDELKALRRAYSISRTSWECEFGTALPHKGHHPQADKKVLERITQLLAQVSQVCRDVNIEQHRTRAHTGTKTAHFNKAADKLSGYFSFGGSCAVPTITRREYQIPHRAPAPWTFAVLRPLPARSLRRPTAIRILHWDPRFTRWEVSQPLLWRDFVIKLTMHWRPSLKKCGDFCPDHI